VDAVDKQWMHTANRKHVADRGRRRMADRWWGHMTDGRWLHNLHRKHVTNRRWRNAADRWWVHACLITCRAAPDDLSKERGAVLEEWRMSRDAAGVCSHVACFQAGAGMRLTQKMFPQRECVLSSAVP